MPPTCTSALVRSRRKRARRGHNRPHAACAAHRGRRVRTGRNGARAAPARVRRGHRRHRRAGPRPARRGARRADRAGRTGPDAARHGRLRGVPPHPRPLGDPAGHHADRARRRLGHRDGPGGGRRRLRGQAGHRTCPGGPHPRRAAARGTVRAGTGGGLRPRRAGDRPRRTDRHQKRRRGRAATHRAAAAARTVGLPGRVFSREQLLESIWDHTFLGDSRLVDAAVARLRAKLEDTPAKPRYVQTVRGFGYRFGPL